MPTTRKVNVLFVQYNDSSVFIGVYRRPIAFTRFNAVIRRVCRRP